MTKQRFAGPLLVLIVLVILLPTTAHGIDFGIRGGVYTDVEEPFFGVELLICGQSHIASPGSTNATAR